jgi:hypothetical protein
MDRWLSPWLSKDGMPGNLALMGVSASYIFPFLPNRNDDIDQGNLKENLGKLGNQPAGRQDNSRAVLIQIEKEQDWENFAPVKCTVVSTFQEQPLEPGIGFQRDQLKGNQSLPDIWQPGQNSLGFCNGSAFQHQDSFIPVGSEIQFPDNACLVKFPYFAGFIFCILLKFFFYCTGQFVFKGKNFHGLFLTL